MSISLQSPDAISRFVLPRLESVTSIFTVSRADTYDYQRCPKIVAIKTFRATRVRNTRPYVQGLPFPIFWVRLGRLQFDWPTREAATTRISF